VGLEVQPLGEVLKSDRGTVKGHRAGEKPRDRGEGYSWKEGDFAQAQKDAGPGVKHIRRRGPTQEKEKKKDIDKARCRATSRERTGAVSQGQAK